MVSRASAKPLEPEAIDDNEDGSNHGGSEEGGVVVLDYAVKTPEDKNVKS
jgi:hypothetical protein